MSLPILYCKLWGLCTMVLHVSILLIQFNFATFLDIIACNLSSNLVYFDFKYFQNKLTKMYNIL